MLRRDVIYTDAAGRPFERPERPAWMDDPEVVPPLTREQVDQWIAYGRAWAEYEDRVLTCGQRAFEGQLCRSLKKS